MEAPGSSPLVPGKGEIIAGKYRVEGVIGRGGMGVVLKATHVRLHQPVAIKMLLPHVVTLPEVVIRFEREARAAAMMKSPHVADVLDVDVTPSGLPYMVMQYLTGNDLAAELKARGALPVQEAVGYLLQTCSAIAHAHAMGIVHRDLKPSNLFLCEGSSPRLLKVLDFGISKTLLHQEDGAVTMTQESLGTPRYMSPEQIRSAKHVDGRTDIWSLGVILYECITNRRPFKGDSSTAMIAAIVMEDPVPIDQARSDIHPALVAAVMRALAKDVDLRFATVDLLGASLAPFGPPESALPAPSQRLPYASSGGSPDSASRVASRRPSEPPASVAPVASAATPTAESALSTPPDWANAPAPSLLSSRAARRIMGAGALALAGGLTTAGVLLTGHPSLPAPAPATASSSPAAAPSDKAAEALPPSAPPLSPIDSSSTPPTIEPASSSAAPLPSVEPHTKPAPSKPPVKLPSPPARPAPSPANNPQHL
jgi:serine/threonine protein kinase